MKLTVEKIDRVIETLGLVAYKIDNIQVEEDCKIAVQVLNEKKNRISAQERFSNLLKAVDEEVSSSDVLGRQMSLDDLYEN